MLTEEIEQRFCSKDNVTFDRLEDKDLSDRDQL